jgi:hypothetical protein
MIFCIKVCFLVCFRLINQTEIFRETSKQNSSVETDYGQFICDTNTWEQELNECLIIPNYVSIHIFKHDTKRGSCLLIYKNARKKSKK